MVLLFLSLIMSEQSLWMLSSQMDGQCKIVSLVSKFHVWPGMALTFHRDGKKKKGKFLDIFVR